MFEGTGGTVKGSEDVQMGCNDNEAYLSVY